jgi:hypothetical protein
VIGVVQPRVHDAWQPAQAALDLVDAGGTIDPLNGKVEMGRAIVLVFDVD